MIKIKELYRTGFPAIGTKIRFSGGETGRVTDVFIRKPKLDNQDDPRVVVQFLHSDGSVQSTSDYPLREYNQWFTSGNGHKLIEEGVYEVVQPRTSP